MVPLCLFYLAQITEREELDDELDDEEIRKIDELAAQRIRAKELESQRLELERRRKNEENERMMLARDREQKRKVQFILIWSKSSVKSAWRWPWRNIVTNVVKKNLLFFAVIRTIDTISFLFYFNRNAPTSND